MAITDELVDDVRRVPLWVWPAGGAALLAIHFLTRSPAPAPAPAITASPGSLVDPVAGGGSAPGGPSAADLAAFESQITDSFTQLSTQTTAALAASQASSADAIAQAQAANVAANQSLAKQLADQAAAFAQQIANLTAGLVKTPNPAGPNAPGVIHPNDPITTQPTTQGTGFTIPAWLAPFIPGGQTVAGYDPNHTLPATLAGIFRNAAGDFFLPNGAGIQRQYQAEVNIRGQSIALPILFTGKGANAEDTINLIVGRLNRIADGAYGWGVTSGSVSDPRNLYIIVRGVIEDQLRAGKSPDSLGIPRYIVDWLLAGSPQPAASAPAPKAAAGPDPLAWMQDYLDSYKQPSPVSNQ